MNGTQGVRKRTFAYVRKRKRKFNAVLRSIYAIKNALRVKRHTGRLIAVPPDFTGFPAFFSAVTREPRRPLPATKRSQTQLQSETATFSPRPRLSAYGRNSLCIGFGKRANFFTVFMQFTTTIIPVFVKNVNCFFSFLRNIPHKFPHPV